MKHSFALALGAALILAALALGANTAVQDVAPRPQAALAFATELHARPTPPPTVTRTPTATPTPLRLDRPEPTAEQVLAKVFQYPYQGTSLGISGARIKLEPLELNDGRRGLIATGDRVTAGRGMHVASGAFGAILLWDRDEYAVRFLRVVLGHGDMTVTLATSPDGAVGFRFAALGLVAEDESRLTHIYIVRPCSASAATAAAAAVESPDPAGADCY